MYAQGMPFWVTGFFIFTLGVFFAVGRAFTPLWVSVFFGNLFSFLGANLLWLGLLKYNNKIKRYHFAIMVLSLLTAILLLCMLNFGPRACPLYLMYKVCCVSAKRYPIDNNMSQAD